MKEVVGVIDALTDARGRGRGVLTFVRCQSDAEVQHAREKFLQVPDFTWHELDASEVEDGKRMLERAKALTADEADAWLCYNLPSDKGDRARPWFFEEMVDTSHLVEVLGGPRIVVLVGIPQMQAFVRTCPELWRKKGAFVGWPVVAQAGGGGGQHAVHVSAQANPTAGPTPNVTLTAAQASHVVDAITTELGKATTPMEKAQLFQKLGLVLMGMNQIEQARVAATKAARAYKLEGQLTGLGQCYELLASLAEKRGNLDVARDWMSHAIETWHQVGVEERVAECHAKKGHLSYVMRDRETAAQQFQLAIEIDEALGNKSKVSAGLRRLGMMAEDEQKFKLAEKLYSDAADLLHKLLEENPDDLQSKVGLSRCFHHLGRMHERMHDYLEAFNQHRESLRLKEELGDKLGIATSYHHLGNTYFFTEEYDQARQCYTQALAIEDEVSDHQGRASTLQQLGEVSMAEDLWGDSLWYFLAAREIWKQIGSPLRHTVELQVQRVSENLDEHTIDQIRNDVIEKTKDYQVD